MTSTAETTTIEATRTYLTELAGHVQGGILNQLEVAVRGDSRWRDHSAPALVGGGDEDG